MAENGPPQHAPRSRADARPAHTVPRSRSVSPPTRPHHVAGSLPMGLRPPPLALLPASREDPPPVLSAISGAPARPRAISRCLARCPEFSHLSRPFHRCDHPVALRNGAEVTAHRSRGHQRVQLENGERRLASSSWRVGRGAGRPPPPSARLGARHGVAQSAASAWRAGKAQEQCTGK